MPEPYYKQHWVDIDSDRHSCVRQDPRVSSGDGTVAASARAQSRVCACSNVGSGPGHTTFELARRVAPGGKVTGVDINAEFVERSGARAREAKLAAEFVHSAFPPLPFPGWIIRPRVVQKCS